MKEELPCFLFFLVNRRLLTKRESRMWFRNDIIRTDALYKIIEHNRNKAENEMIQIISEIMQTKELPELNFCIGEMVTMLDLRGIKTEHIYIRRILQYNWELKPCEPKHYNCYHLNYDGAIEMIPKTGRFYTMKKEKLEQILLLC